MIKCKKPCRFRTEIQAALDNAAIDAQQEANRQEILRQNADIRAAEEAANPEIAAARLAREQAEEEAARREEAIRLFKENEARRTQILQKQKDAQKKADQMKNRKKYLKKYIEEVDFKLLDDLNPRLYKHYGQSVSEQKTTTEYVDKIKELRNKYIKLWNYSNDFYDDYDPLWNHINDKIADYFDFKISSLKR